MTAEGIPNPSQPPRRDSNPGGGRELIKNPNYRDQSRVDQAAQAIYMGIPDTWEPTNLGSNLHRDEGGTFLATVITPTIPETPDLSDIAEAAIWKEIEMSKRIEKILNENKNEALTRIGFRIDIAQPLAAYIDRSGKVDIAYEGKDGEMMITNDTYAQEWTSKLIPKLNDFFNAFLTDTKLSIKLTSNNLLFEEKDGGTLLHLIGSGSFSEIQQSVSTRPGTQGLTREVEAPKRGRGRPTNLGTIDARQLISEGVPLKEIEQRTGVPLKRLYTIRERMQKNERTVEHEPLTTDELEYLTAMALGKLTIGKITMQERARPINAKLGTASSLEAMLVAMQEGLIAPGIIIQGVAPDALTQLNEDDIVLLETTIENNGRESTNKKLAERLSTPDRPLTEKAIESRFIRINAKIDSPTKERSVAIFAVAKMFEAQNAFQMPEPKKAHRKTPAPQLTARERTQPERTLAQQEQQILTLLTQGFQQETISTQLEISPEALRESMTQIDLVLGIEQQDPTRDQNIRRILTALRQGRVNPETIRREFDLTNFDSTKLNRFDRDILDAILITDGELKHTTDPRIRDTSQKLGTRNLEQAVAAWLLYSPPDEKFVINKLAQGFVTHEIQSTAESQTPGTDQPLAKTWARNTLTKLNNKFHAPSQIQLALTAHTLGLIETNALATTYNHEALSTLTGEDKILLDQIIQDHGKRGNTNALASDLHTTPDRIEYLLSTIIATTGTKNKTHLALVWKIFQQQAAN